jgi:TctA family transporter
MGMKDVLRHWKLWLRSSIIGYIIGIIPGAGATTATFIAYGQAKQFSKNRDKFGTGVVEGVIAPESANNGKEGGALLTTLALGIPGSAELALLLSIMLATGIVPGPRMLTEHLSLSLYLILIIIVVNFLAIVICLPLVSTLARVARVPAGVLVPIIIILGFFGAYAARTYLIDVGVALIIGAIGVVMDRFNFSRPAMLLGFVLGFLFEKYLWYGINIGGPTFFLTPGSLIMIAFIILVLFLNPLQKLIARRRGG